ncbi:MAG: redoxin domain-containing protein [Saprospiraceae bacterium]|nr:redoxin domain-containing protein [Lewinellaceae bacterium]
MILFRKVIAVLFLCIGGINTAWTQIGFTAPNFTVVSTHGDTIRLYDILDGGQFVVLDFFFTTCGPCIYFTPEVNLAFEKYGCNTQDVVFIAIDYQDTNAEVQAYDQQHDIQYPSVSGTQGGGNGVVSQYVISAFPTFLLIHPNYKIVDEIFPPTLVVFDTSFATHGIAPEACLTSTAAPAAMQSLVLYPNPVQTSLVTLDLRRVSGDRVTIFVQDLAGRTMLTEVAQGLNDGLYQLDLCTIPEGLYFVTAVAEDGMRWDGRLVKY